MGWVAPNEGEPRVAYEAARLRLARFTLEGAQARAKAVRHAVRISAHALRVERVGVWMLKDGGRALECLDTYVLSTDVHTVERRLDASEFPGYLAALCERRAIVAHDARTDASTRELTESYLVPHGITSMLDAPIIRAGRVIGTVCFEHVGPRRDWSQADVGFAAAVADMVTIIFEQADRLEAEARARQATEERLAHLKMEALGRLARSVAHDFNNVLTTIRLLAGELDEHADEAVRARARDIGEAVDVSARLARQLLVFGRETAPKIEPVRLDQLLERLRPILETALGSSIVLAIDVLAARPEALVDASQLEQIVLNLCLNARDAVVDAGHVTVRVRDPGPDDAAAGFVLLEVVDDGVGMDQATVEQIFEPYFTTKTQGTGLGLATVYWIVTGMGGRLRVASEPGKGTTFTVALPRADAQVEDGAGGTGGAAAQGAPLAAPPGTRYA